MSETVIRSSKHRLKCARCYHRQLVKQTSLAFVMFFIFFLASKAIKESNDPTSFLGMLWASMTDTPGGILALIVLAIFFLVGAFEVLTMDIVDPENVIEGHCTLCKKHFHSDQVDERKPKSTT